MGINYWPRFPGDYARDTRDLSLAEHGAYTLLLDHYYSTEGQLPEALASLHRICGAQDDLERAAVEAVASRFFRVVGGRRRNKRADRQLELRAAFTAEQSRKGKIGAGRRWGGGPGPEDETPPEADPEGALGMAAAMPAAMPAAIPAAMAAAVAAVQPVGIPDDSPPSPSPSPSPTPEEQGTPPGEVRNKEGKGPPPPGLEPDVFRGEILVVDRMQDARLRGLGIPPAFLAELYRRVDVKIAGQQREHDRWDRPRMNAYLATIACGAWDEARRRGDAKHFDSPPARPAAAVPAPPITPEEEAEGRAVLGALLEDLERRGGNGGRGRPRRLRDQQQEEEQFDRERQAAEDRRREELRAQALKIGGNK